LFIQDGNVAEKFEIRELNKLLIRELAWHAVTIYGPSPIAYAR
jgi:hypothetical protein